MVEWLRPPMGWRSGATGTESGWLRVIGLEQMAETKQVRKKERRVLRERRPVQIGKGLQPVRVDWKAILNDSEQAFLTDNQLSVFVDPKNPGCQRIHFYPLPFVHRFMNEKWNFEELVNHDSLRSQGPALNFKATKTTLEFWPHRIKKTMTAGKTRIVEQLAVSGNTLVMEWDVRGLPAVTLNFSLPYYDAKTREIPNGICASIRKQAFTAMVIEGADDVRFTVMKESPFESQAEISFKPGKKIVLALTCGYDETSVVKSATSAAKKPQTILDAAEKTWNDYFTKIVPRFVCSDKKLEKLYYYQAYVTRANLYDIPYEPFTYPYTCPWKTGAVWQWSWNTPMDSVAERWLNDKQIGAGGILLEHDNGGGLNIGTYLHPVKKVKKLRGHVEHAEAVGRYLKKLPPKIDLPVYTTIPHTTPNGLLGAWEYYLCSGDKKFLAGAFETMQEAEREFSTHELGSGLCTTSFVDEFDYSLRLKPYIKAFKKADPEMMLKMDTPFIAIDYNCYLYALRNVMIEAAKELNLRFDGEKMRRKNEKLKSAIQQYLWNEHDGWFYDADPRNMKLSNVRMLSACSAMYAGVATKEQADRMVTHLSNKKEFATPWPCPSVSMDTPEVDPSIITYGGDIEITSGVWFAVEGLMRYGYKKLAADYIKKTIRMMTKDGPSSSYSYHCLTGKYNQPKHILAAQSVIVTDLICKYLVGLNPQATGEIILDAPALKSYGLKHFTFGPYRYRNRTITVKWANNKLSMS